jgi:hypothetical protein
VDEAQRDAALLAKKRMLLDAARDAKRAAHADSVACLARLNQALTMSSAAAVLDGVLYDRTRRTLRRGAKGKGEGMRTTALTARSRALIALLKK